MPIATMKQLLETGVHFGHQTRRWNPKMERFIFGERNGIYIIDLQQTLRQIHLAYRFVRETVENGGTVLFVGTKKQAQDAVALQAQRCGMFYVNQRWLGGMLTNHETIKKSIARLRLLEEMETDGTMAALPKKEATKLLKEKRKLDKNLSGVKEMGYLPGVIFLVDTKRETIALSEANKLAIPSVGIVDTNCDPDLVTYPIPGNDDAIRAINLYASIIADAVLDAGAGRRDEEPAVAQPVPPPSVQEVVEIPATAEVLGEEEEISIVVPVEEEVSAARRKRRPKVRPTQEVLPEEE